MRILHLLSNRKWTERSEPAVDLALSEKKLGAEVMFVCGKSARQSQNDVEFNAKRKGLDSTMALNMPKHFQLMPAAKDIRHLKKIIAGFKPQIINCHMQNAHLVASVSRWRSKSPLIIRTCYDPEGPDNDIRSRFLYKYCTDGLVVISKSAGIKAIKAYDFPCDRVQVAMPGIELQRFSLNKNIAFNRSDFGLKKEHFVIGIVSRIRATRGIGMVLKAVHTLAEKYPRLRVLIVGRGRKHAVYKIIEEPSKAMNISDNIILAGYCREDKLVAAYRSMDTLVYPVPGTDKTCRTVREAMASGVPVIAPKTGFLPELITDGKNGRIIDFTSQSLSETLEDIIICKAKLGNMADMAYKTAHEKFSPLLRAEKTLMLYNTLLTKNATASKSTGKYHP